MVPVQRVAARPSRRSVRRGQGRDAAPTIACPKRRSTSIYSTASNRTSSSSASSSARQARSLSALLDLLNLDAAEHECLLYGASTTSTISQVAEATVELLINTYSQARVKRLLVNNPALLTVDLSLWLDFLTGYGFSAHDVYTLIHSNGRNWQQLQIFAVGQLFLFLQQQCGLTPNDIRQTVILRHPQALHLQLDHLNHLGVSLSRLGCTAAGVRALLLSHPRVLSCCVSTDIDAKLGHLRAFGISDSMFPTFVPAVIYHFIAEPQESVVGKLQYFSSIGIDAPTLQLLLAACPVLWSLAVTDIMDKWNFLTRVMGLTLADVLLYPRFFEKDLMCCIRPRYLLLEELSSCPRRDFRAASGSLSGSGAGWLQNQDLAGLLECTDAAFPARVGVTMAQYLEFYNGLVANQYYGVKAAVDVHDRPEPCRG